MPFFGLLFHKEKVNAMRVLLVYCNIPFEYEIPVSMSQISACLKEAGFDVGLFETTFYKIDNVNTPLNYLVDSLQLPPVFLKNERPLPSDMIEDFRAKLEKFNPDVIGFSMVEASVGIFARLLDVVSGGPYRSVPVMVGGPFAILAPDALTRFDRIDFICTGEGESAMPALCNALKAGADTGSADGFWVNDRRNHRWIKNARPKVNRLDALPPLDFSTFGEHRLTNTSSKKQIYVETSRGCPYHCTFCSDNAIKTIFRDDGAGSWYRMKSIPRVAAELETNIARYNPDLLLIRASTFLTCPTRRVAEFSEMYQKFSLPFWFFVRPENVTEEKIGALRSHIRVPISVSIGLEHGNEAFRAACLNRKYTNEEFKNACRILSKYDVRYNVNFIFGFPGETRDLVFDSIGMIREVCGYQPTSSFSAFIYTPLRGTVLWDQCREAGMIEKDAIGGGILQYKYALKNNTLSADEVIGLSRTAALYIKMDKNRYNDIQKAESLTNEGDRAFEALRSEYYAMRKWPTATQ